MTKPIIRDWTQETLVLDLVNSIGETYHFEIEPNEDANSIPTRASDAPGSNLSATIVGVQLPIAFPADT